MHRLVPLQHPVTHHRQQGHPHTPVNASLDTGPILTLIVSAKFGADQTSWLKLSYT